MAIGEQEVYLRSAANLQNQDLEAGMVTVFDNQGSPKNSNAATLAGCLPTGSGDRFLGVVVDKPRKDSTGAVIAGQSYAYADIGYQMVFAGPTASGVIAVGDRVSFDGTAGQVKTVADGNLMTSFGTAMTPSAAQGTGIIIRIGGI